MSMRNSDILVTCHFNIQLKYISVWKKKIIDFAWHMIAEHGLLHLHSGHEFLLTCTYITCKVQSSVIVRRSRNSEPTEIGIDCIYLFPGHLYWWWKCFPLSPFKFHHLYVKCVMVTRQSFDTLKILLSTSHLVIETSQQIHDVPYGDHFRVEVSHLSPVLV